MTLALVRVLTVQQDHHVGVLLDRVVDGDAVGDEVVGPDDRGVVDLLDAVRLDRDDASHSTSLTARPRGRRGPAAATTWPIAVRRWPAAGCTPAPPPTSASSSVSASRTSRTVCQTCSEDGSACGLGALASRTASSSISRARLQSPYTPISPRNRRWSSTPSIESTAVLQSTRRCRSAAGAARRRPAPAAGRRVIRTRPRPVSRSSCTEPAIDQRCRRNSAIWPSAGMRPARGRRARSRSAPAAPRPALGGRGDLRRPTRSSTRAPARAGGPRRGNRPATTPSAAQPS